MTPQPPEGARATPVDAEAPGAGGSSPAVPGPTRRAGGRRGRAVLLLLLLAGATAVSALPTWFVAHGTEALHGTVDVRVSGTDAAPAVLAAALVLAASALAAALVGRAGRWVVALVVAVAGVLVVAATIGVVRDPVASVHEAVAGATGVGQVVGGVTTTAWPWVAVTLGAVAVVVGAWLPRAARAWARPSRRHEQAAAPARGAERPDERSAWDALSRGEDPT
ncbi:Trp biosynthesis-associated membrane protein [Cellulomonas alba]|uniref:Trp biosynthesis-associated membrane protein n=1 Tax=Cellulomonas alba TaxID=3053467 RepID=A0ABT7SJL3_9CELL|nr:Trp biosynthesis-associated membrane protein [Cellulomonas alba]MDM7856368.1 Trp biosynthesis-associated membrane protein [Cellulomonas alba]